MLKFIRKQENIFVFSVLSAHWDGGGSWNPSPWKIRTCLYYIINTMATDGLAIKVLWWYQLFSTRGFIIIIFTVVANLTKTLRFQIDDSHSLTCTKQMILADHIAIILRIQVNATMELTLSASYSFCHTDLIWWDGSCLSLVQVLPNQHRAVH